MIFSLLNIFLNDIAVFRKLFSAKMIVLYFYNPPLIPIIIQDQKDASSNWQCHIFSKYCQYFFYDHQLHLTVINKYYR